MPWPLSGRHAGRARIRRRGRGHRAEPDPSAQAQADDHPRTRQDAGKSIDGRPVLRPAVADRRAACDPPSAALRCIRHRSQGVLSRVNAAAAFMGEAEGAERDPTALRERLAEFGIGAAEAAALRALGRTISADTLGRAVLAAMEHVWDEPPAADEPADRRFCRAMARLAHWNLEPDLFNEIADAWLECCAQGTDAGYGLRVAKALLDCGAEALVGDGKRLSQPEFEILIALQRVALCVVSLLGDTTGGESAIHSESETCDTASGLSNGQRFAALLNEQFAAVGDAKVGLIIVQVDHDKAAMPILSASDRTLAAELAERMRASLREQDTLCVLGTFEWAIVLRDLRAPAQVGLACSRVVEACLTPLRLGERRHLVIARAGGACYPDDATEAVALVRAARLALDAAQRHSTPYELFHGE